MTALLTFILNSFRKKIPPGIFFLDIYQTEPDLKIVYCGDVVGRPGREAVFDNIGYLKNEFKPDVLAVNVENASHGFGVTAGIAKEFLSRGVDALLTGNHVWQQRDIIPFLSESKKIIRPLNYPEDLPGRGAMEIMLPDGRKILIVQVLGRLFMEAVDCPVQTIDKLLKNYVLGRNINAVLVDIHAEATSEKLSFGYYLDGRVSVVAGTHTHVPTADARILPRGTAYITDVGMCGDYNSVLGFEITEPINRLARRYSGGRLAPAKGKGTVFAIFVETDDTTGLAKRIEQIKLI